MTYGCSEGIASMAFTCRILMLLPVVDRNRCKKLEATRVASSYPVVFHNVAVGFNHTYHPLSSVNIADCDTLKLHYSCASLSYHHNLKKKSLVAEC